MTRQAESSGMCDTLSVDQEDVRLLADLFRDPHEQGAFSEPEKTRYILGRHTIDDRRSLNYLHVHYVPDGSGDKGSVALVGCVHSAQVSRLEAWIIDAFDTG